jgi:hypothetical protein
MSKTTWKGYPTHPGLAGTPGIARQMFTHPAQGRDAFLPDTIAALLSETVVLADIGSRYAVALYTETLDNSGTAAMVAGGYQLLSNATAGDNDDLTIISKRCRTLAAEKVYWAQARIEITENTKQGISMGFVTAGDVEIISADPTDGVFLHCAATANTVVGMTVENGNASADTGTLHTLADATAVELGIIFQASTDINKCWGEWWVDGTRTAFTADQLADLDAMITTTAPSLAFQIGTRNATSDTTQKQLLIDYAFACVDR